MPTETSERAQMPLDALAAAVPGARVIGKADGPVTGIAYNSKQVQPGDLFVALVGGYDDGHVFAGDACERGARALLVERELPVDLPQIVVEDSRASLARVAAAFYGHPSRELTVIGITGTDGKTTTSYILEAILRNAGIRTGLIGTVAVRIDDRTVDADTRQTTPESLDVQRRLRQMVDHGVQVAIVESTSHGLALHRLDETRFLTGAVTNITHEHLEYHKTIDAYRRAKAILFERVAEANGNAVINLDDEGARSMRCYAGGARVITYGIDALEADVRAEAIETGVDGTRFTLTTPSGSKHIESRLVGRFNVANMLCAAAVALAHDITVDLIAATLEEPIPVPGRMESIRAGQPFSVVVDYAHTPESIEKVLRLLRDLNPSGRLLIVMGSAGERDREKRPLQGAVAARLADRAVFTTEDPRFEDADTIIEEIAAGAVAVGAVRGRDFDCVTDRTEAIARAFALAETGDTVLLAGKGHERSIIWGKEKRPWDEAGVATEVLRAMGFDGAS